MHTTSKLSPLLALAAIATAFAVGGCGSNTPPPTTHPDADIIATAAGASGGTSSVYADGQAIFVSSGCAGCHTFAPAGSKGTLGPNLAEISKEGAATVKTAIVDPNSEIAPGYKKGVMPADFGTKLSKQQMAALVAFVAQTKGSDKAAGGTSTTSTAAPDGKAIFASAGCAGCHAFAPAGSKGTIGPNLGEISKEGAATVKTAIVDPNSEIAPGYKKGVMPTDFGTTLSKAEMAALVKFITTGK